MESAVQFCQGIHQSGVALFRGGGGGGELLLHQNLINNKNLMKHCMWNELKNS